MPGFTVTRGFGPGATPTQLIARGFIPAVAEKVIRIIRGGRSSLKKVRQNLEESLSISIMLIGTNGKELVSPIIRKVSKSFNASRYLSVAAKPTELTIRKHTKTKVEVTKLKVRNKKYERD